MDINEILEEYFKQLDQALVDQNGFFKNRGDKERYETIFMYTIRKYHAARYHFKNVNRFLEKERADVEKIKTIDFKEINNSALKKFRSAKITFESYQTKQFTADHYVYELSAFLEALKSSIDFLSSAIGFHLGGIELDSVRTLIKLVKKGRSGSLLDEIRNNLSWLEYIRSYRHHVVHRLIFSTRGGYTSYNVDGFSGVINYPIVIPGSPPTYIPDTRESREWENINGSQSGLSKMITESHMINGNGKKKRTDFELKFSPSLRYISIEEFMKSQLDSYELFFVQVLEKLIELNFKKVLV